MYIIIYLNLPISIYLLDYIYISIYMSIYSNNCMLMYVLVLCIMNIWLDIKKGNIININKILISFSLLISLYIYIYNFIHTYLCIHLLIYIYIFLSTYICLSIQYIYLSIYIYFHCRFNDNAWHSVKILRRSEKVSWIYKFFYFFNAITIFTFLLY